MEKTPLEIAQEAFRDWLTLIASLAEDALLSFEEFTGHGLRRDLPKAGEALARAEHCIRQAHEFLCASIHDLRPEESAPEDDDTQP